MPTWTKIEIENYQSHDHSVLNLAEGTNVIVGPSDSGKSSILRAINWVLTNRPLGDSFRSEWGGQTRVSIYTSDGHVVERIRSASRNDYVIDGTVLSAFGTEVPQAVLDILQLDTLNTQSQMDIPFLLAMSPGEAARLLNKAAALDDIDFAIAGLHRTQSGLNRDIKSGTATLEKYQAQLSEYDDLPELEQKIQLVEAWEEEYRIKKSAYLRKDDLVGTISYLSEHLEELPDTDALQQRYDQLQGLVASYQKGVEQYNKKNVLQNQAWHFTYLLEQMKNTEEKERQYNDLTTRKEEWEKKERTVTALQWHVEHLRKLQGIFSSVNIRLTEATEEFKGLSPETCPLCGNSMRNINATI